MKRWLIGMLYLAILNTLMIITAACGASPLTAVAPATPTVAVSTEVTPELNNQLVIYFFEYDDIGPINLETDNTTAKLQQIDLAKSQHQLSDEDMVSYDWLIQIITLTPTLREKYQDLSSNFLGYGTLFVFTFKGEPFFAGTILPTMSALSTKFPVLYVLEGPMYPSDSFQIALRPQRNTVALTPGPSSFPVVSSEKAEAVRQYLSALGKLTP